MEKPLCKLIGENGNVFNLIGIVRRTLKQHHLPEELKEFENDLSVIMENGGSYHDILNMFHDYVDVA